MNVIIILNYNDYKTTIGFLNQIRSYKVLDKIIVVDNASTDGSYEILKKMEDEKIDIIKNTSNSGYGAGNNYGIRYAESKYSPEIIIISNPDIEVEEKSIINIINTILADKRIGMATGLIYGSDNKVVSNFAWRVPKYKDILVGCFFSGYKFVRSILKTGIYFNVVDFKNKEKLYVEAVPGCFFIIKDQVIKSIGYFDEDTFLFNEENILAFKLKKNNYKACIVPDAKIIHFNSISINRNIKSQIRKHKILFDSTEIYLRKYLKVNAYKSFIFTILFWIGKVEQALVGRTTKYIKGK
jgi:GT2 family glycosyltransferase